MSDSIIATRKCCFFCGKQRNLERHHALKSANRKLAEQDGLWVWLCADCHRGTNGVHGKNGHGKDEALKAAAEYAWLTYYQKEIPDFIKRYGKNYLEL